MPGIGVGLVWFSYWWGLAGVSMVKGWNNNLLQLANPIHPPKFVTLCYTGPGVWPSGDPADSGACHARQIPLLKYNPQRNLRPQGTLPLPKSGACPAGYTKKPITPGSNQFVCVKDLTA